MKKGIKKFLKRGFKKVFKNYKLKVVKYLSSFSVPPAERMNQRGKMKEEGSAEGRTAS